MRVLFLHDSAVREYRPADVDVVSWTDWTESDVPPLEARLLP